MDMVLNGHGHSLSANNKWTNGYELMDMGSPNLQLYIILVIIFKMNNIILITSAIISSKINNQVFFYELGVYPNVS